MGPSTAGRRWGPWSSLGWNRTRGTEASPGASMAHHRQRVVVATLVTGAPPTTMHDRWPLSTSIGNDDRHAGTDASVTRCIRDFRTEGVPAVRDLGRVPGHQPAVAGEGRRAADEDIVE